MRKNKHEISFSVDDLHHISGALSHMGVIVVKTRAGHDERKKKSLMTTFQPSRGVSMYFPWFFFLLTVVDASLSDVSR